MDKLTKKSGRVALPNMGATQSILKKITRPYVLLGKHLLSVIDSIRTAMRQLPSHIHNTARFDTALPMKVLG